MKTSNCILVSTTNNKFKYIENKQGLLYYIKDYSAKFLYNDRFLITSNVNSIIEDNEYIKLITLNSIYIFKKI